jgi:hypothetical protein
MNISKDSNIENSQYVMKLSVVCWFFKVVPLTFEAFFYSMLAVLAFGWGERGPCPGR